MSSLKKIGPVTLTQ